MKIYLGHVEPIQEMNCEERKAFEQKVKRYGRVYFREDAFGCIYHEEHERF